MIDRIIARMWLCWFSIVPIGIALWVFPWQIVFLMAPALLVMLVLAWPFRKDPDYPTLGGGISIDDMSNPDSPHYMPTTARLLAEERVRRLEEHPDKP